MTNADAVVIGGGFYGAMIAIHLAEKHGFQQIYLIERESALMRRASYNNQARVHSGYHYPRNFITAYRSRINMPRFIQDWPGAIQSNFTHLYAVARHNSKVTSREFVRFCKKIGTRIEPADSKFRSLFETRLIEDVFIVEEVAFDSKKISELMKQKLAQLKIQVCLNSEANYIKPFQDKSLEVILRHLDNKDEAAISSRYIFNCTYSRLNQFENCFADTRVHLKQEITEMALIIMPPILEALGITVMDGHSFPWCLFRRVVCIRFRMSVILLIDIGMIIVK